MEAFIDAGPPWSAVVVKAQNAASGGGAFLRQEFLGRDGKIFCEAQGWRGRSDGLMLSSV
jgi:hypothetical protein